MPLFLAVATADASGCPAGSALQCVELSEIPEGFARDEPFEGWPGLATVPDDGRALWVPPPKPVVPESITNFQVRAALMGMPSPTGITNRTLFNDVDDTLRAEAGLAWTAWEYANEVTRDGELVNSLGVKLGMTAAQLDQLFITASGISA